MRAVPPGPAAPSRRSKISAPSQRSAGSQGSAGEERRDPSPPEPPGRRGRDRPAIPRPVAKSRPRRPRPAAPGQAPASSCLLPLPPLGARRRGSRKKHLRQALLGWGEATSRPPSLAAPPWLGVQSLSPSSVSQLMSSPRLPPT